MIHANMLHAAVVSETGLKSFTPSVVFGATREVEMALDGTEQNVPARPNQCRNPGMHDFSFLNSVNADGSTPSSLHPREST